MCVHKFSKAHQSFVALLQRMIELIKASNDDLSVDAIRLLLIDAIGPEFVERHSGTHAALDMLLRKIDINGSKSIACDELCLYLVTV